MKGGFSFCGTDIYDLNLEYVPENKDTYVYNPTTSDIDELTFKGHDGGYFFGTSLKPKDFTLKCFFENNDIRYGIYTSVYNVFKVGRTGKLIFKNRPWFWYTATVTGVNADSLLNYRNGFITITLRSYYPYSRCDFYYNDGSTENIVDLESNSAILSPTMTMPSLNLDNESNITSDFSFLLYNPGVVDCPVAVEIAGNVDQGVYVINNTTEQEMHFIGISKAATSDVDKYIVCDSINGKTILTDGTSSNSTNAFVYHDYGFINLKSSYPIDRNVLMYPIEDGTEVFIEDDVSDVIGKYFYIDDKWIKILESTGYKTYSVNKIINFVDPFKTDIVLMNEMQVKAKSSMDLTRLRFSYKPTFY